MNWDEVLKIVGSILGVVVSLVSMAGVGGYLMKRWIKSVKKNAAAQVDAARQEGVARVKAAEADAGKRVAELESASAQNQLALQMEILRLQQACRELEIERDRASTELTAAHRQLAGMESFDGKLWEREVTATPPPFLDMTRRKTRLVSVMNLKGGVGKTTLTANIGVGLARKGYRVLLVDLDFQGSLTRLCMDLDGIKESLDKTRTVNRFLGENAPPVGDVAQRVRGVILERGCCDIIAAGENLAEAELRVQGRWLAAPDPDVRFLFRRSFHAVDVCGAYDYVFFDCPPRLTTASINALACSDYLLVPVVLEQGSVEAMPRTLTWLNKLPHVARARLLGVVANRVEFWGTQIIASQRTVYNYLSDTVSHAGFGASAVFRAMVRNNRAKIEDAANAGRIASAKDDGLELFSKVVDEVEGGTRP